MFAAPPPVRVGLLLDKGGRDDKSFNASAYRGAMEAKKKFNVEVKVVEASDDTAIDPALRTFAQRGYQLVIGIGFVQSSATKKVAPDFPKTHFMVVDSEVKLPNVRSVLFKEQEGAYLVGAMAALLSKMHVVSFIGGMDIPLIRRFELGYRTGVQDTSPKTQVLSNYVGATSEAWKNPTKAKELALAQFQRQSDIVFQAAGASGMGVFDAAEEQHKFAIGVDSNQNWIKPGVILTSMVKKVDSAVYSAIEELTKGVFEPGIYHLGLKENGVDFALDENNRALIPEKVLTQVNELKKKIIDKKVVVQDYFEVARRTASPGKN